MSFFPSLSSHSEAIESSLVLALHTSEQTAPIESIGTWWMWLLFFTLVLVVLAIDLVFVGGGRQHRVSVKEALGWTLVWVTLALSFGAGLWWYLDIHYTREFATTKTLEYFTGYLIEKALAVDNVFVWLMLFNFFAIPLELQKRVLTYGVLGAIVLRTLMIFAGAWLLTQFHWLLYFFGVFLLITGIKMWWVADTEVDIHRNPLLNWLKQHLPISSHLCGEDFFVRHKGVLLMTPLFLTLIMVEISDIIFAVDSIPAIFAITTDPFIILTSNIFAILGLRAMYFLLADMADRFAYLKYGLAWVLVFIGTKMVLIDIYKIPIGISLSVVALLIGGSVVISWLKTRPSTQPDP